MHEEVNDVILKMQNHKYYDLDGIPTEHLENLSIPVRSRYKQMLVSPHEAKMLASNIKSSVLQYEFSHVNCTGGKVTYHYCITSIRQCLIIPVALIYVIVFMTTMVKQIIELSCPEARRYAY